MKIYETMKIVDFFLSKICKKNGGAGAAQNDWLRNTDFYINHGLTYYECCGAPSENMLQELVNTYNETESVLFEKKVLSHLV
jgi:hypothetical protein